MSVWLLTLSLSLLSSVFHRFSCGFRDSGLIDNRLFGEDTAVEVDILTFLNCSSLAFVVEAIGVLSGLVSATVFAYSLTRTPPLPCP